MVNKKKNKALKIVQIHWGFPPIIGGVETHLTLLGPELVRRGHKVYLLTGLPEAAEAKENYQGIEVYRTPLFDLNWLSKRGFEALESKLQTFLFNYLESIKPDIIHAHNMHYFSIMHAMLLNRYTLDKKIPLILTAHNVWDDGLFLDSIHKIKWQHIIAVSEFIKDELYGVGVAKDKITTVYHGIDVGRFKPGSRELVLKRYPQFKDRRVIFHPARIGLAKGCDTSIKALQLVKKEVPEAMLVLCGSKNIIDWSVIQEKDIAYLIHLIKVLGLENDVHIDMIPHNLISKFYRLASVSIYPSSACEPFGITMLESLAVSVPMIVTNTGGMPEIITDGINGFIIKVKNYKDLADRIIMLLKDETLRKKLGEKGREMVLEKFTTEKMTDNILKIYYKILEENR